jgi:hypothetical protein
MSYLSSQNFDDFAEQEIKVEPNEWNDRGHHRHGRQYQSRWM